MSFLIQNLNEKIGQKRVFTDEMNLMLGLIGKKRQDGDLKSKMRFLMADM